MIFRFTGPFTARDMSSSAAPTAFHHIFDCELTPADATPITNIFDLTAVPIDGDSSGIGQCLSVIMSAAAAKVFGSLLPEPTR